MKPLVSILIPAYNAEKTIAYTLQSAVGQTWPHKEIIVVDDGSTDRTAEIVRRFASKGVVVVSTENRGLSGAVNQAFHLCQGDYIQELDADDLLAPDKIERQLLALRQIDGSRRLLISPWAPFYYRTRTARANQNSLCQDLAPVEFLLRKMGENVHMQNATWLVGRDIWEAAGPWDESLNYDQDGEFFCRVLLASAGTRFVPEGRVFYRITGSSRLSHVGSSKKKKESLLRSMKLHVQYIRSLEDSERVRSACLTYLQNWYGNFYPDTPDLALQLENLAGELGGGLVPTALSWKYAWIKNVFGSKAVKHAQSRFPQMKGSVVTLWEKAMFRLERDHESLKISRGLVP